MELNKKITQGQWLIVIVMIIIWFLFSVGVFVYFKNQCSIAQKTPLKYIAEKYDLESCSCIRIDKDFFYFNRSRAWIERKPTEFFKDIDLSEITEEKEET